MSTCFPLYCASFEKNFVDWDVQRTVTSAVDFCSWHLALLFCQNPLFHSCLKELLHACGNTHTQRGWSSWCFRRSKQGIFRKRLIVALPFPRSLITGLPQLRSPLLSCLEALTWLKGSVGKQTSFHCLYSSIPNIALMPLSKKKKRKNISLFL